MVLNNVGSSWSNQHTMAAHFARGTAGDFSEATDGEKRNTTALTYDGGCALVASSRYLGDDTESYQTAVVDHRATIRHEIGSRVQPRSVGARPPTLENPSFSNIKSPATTGRLRRNPRSRRTRGRESRVEKVGSDDRGASKLAAQNLLREKKDALASATRRAALRDEGECRPGRLRPDLRVRPAGPSGSSTLTPESRVPTRTAWTANYGRRPLSSGIAPRPTHEEVGHGPGRAILGPL